MAIAKYLKALTLAAAVSLSGTALADDDKDIEGNIESLDRQARTFMVGGMTFYADDRTDYDDDLNSFSDLREGQRVEVDYIERNGKHYAKEIELDD